MDRHIGPPSRKVYTNKVNKLWLNRDGRLSLSNPPMGRHSSLFIFSTFCLILNRSRILDFSPHFGPALWTLLYYDIYKHGVAMFSPWGLFWWRFWEGSVLKRYLYSWFRSERATPGPDVTQLDQQHVYRTVFVSTIKWQVQFFLIRLSFIWGLQESIVPKSQNPHQTRQCQSAHNGDVIEVAPEITS